MPSKKQLETYLSSIVGGKSKKRVHVEYFGPLSEYSEPEELRKKSTGNTGEIKKLGYGIPYLIVYNSGGSSPGKKEKIILSTMRISHGFGHDYRADRVDNLVLSYDTWNELPNHCKIQDIGAFDKTNSSMISLGDAGEFFLLRSMIQGTEYFKDLDRIFASGKLEETDALRAKALAEYLLRIHSKKNANPDDKELYVRKIRDTVGHGECIFGIADSYPSSGADYLRDRQLELIEKQCVEHRWRLKTNTTRLCQVHGDFHPWNILFSNDPKNPTKFGLLDRSRGAWGEPADDICALAINYIFYSIRKYGKLDREFSSLYEDFLKAYISNLDGEEKNGLFDSMPLFFTFRALVVASPLWYPDLTSETRRKILGFAQNSLETGHFDPFEIDDLIPRGN